MTSAFAEVATAPGGPTALLARTVEGQEAKAVKDRPAEPRCPVPICAWLAAP